MFFNLIFCFYFSIIYLFVFCLIFLGRVLLCSLSWPWTHPQPAGFLGTTRTGCSFHGFKGLELNQDGEGGRERTCREQALWRTMRSRVWRLGDLLFSISRPWVEYPGKGIPFHAGKCEIGQYSLSTVSCRNGLYLTVTGLRYHSHRDS